MDCPTPMLDKAAQYYEDASSSGLGEKDVSAMYGLLESMLGSPNRDGVRLNNGEHV